MKKKLIIIIVFILLLISLSLYYTYAIDVTIEEVENSSNADLTFNINIEDIKQWLCDGQNDMEFPAYESDIKNIFKTRGNIRANDILQECVQRAKNRLFLREQPKEEWESKQKYPKYYLSI